LFSGSESMLLCEKRDSLKTWKSFAFNRVSSCWSTGWIN